MSSSRSRRRPAATHGTDFTELADVFGTTPDHALHAQAKENETDVDCSWSSASPYGMIAFEVLVAAAGGDVLLAATLTSSSTVAGELAVEKPLASAVASSSAVAGELAVEKPLAATIASASRLVAALEVAGADVVRRLRLLLGVGQ